MTDSTDNALGPELLPCPFCGGKPYLANVAMVGCAYVVCTDCRMQSDDGGKDRVVAAWNTRADLAPAPLGAVKVKPLEWETPSAANNWIYQAHAPWGTYGVHICGGRHQAWLEAHERPYERWLGDGYVGSVAEAQSIAAADHAERARGLLLSVPEPADPLADPRVKALEAKLAKAVEALESVISCSNDVGLVHDAEATLAELEGENQ